MSSYGLTQSYTSPLWALPLAERTVFLRAISALGPSRERFGLAGRMAAWEVADYAEHRDHRAGAR